MTPCGASLRARASSLRSGDVGDRDPVGVGQGDDVGDAVVGRAVVADQLGREPHLVDLAAPGDQQLADGLAALDLLAAETLGAPGRMGIAGVTPDRPGAAGAARPRRGVARAAAGRVSCGRRLPGGLRAARPALLRPTLRPSLDGRPAGRSIDRPRPAGRLAATP